MNSSSPSPHSFQRTNEHIIIIVIRTCPIACNNVYLLFNFTYFWFPPWSLQPYVWCIWVKCARFVGFWIECLIFICLEILSGCHHILSMFRCRWVCILWQFMFASFSCVTTVCQRRNYFWKMKKHHRTDPNSKKTSFWEKVRERERDRKYMRRECGCIETIKLKMMSCTVTMWFPFALYLML